MRYVCDDCGSVFEEPNETKPIGTNEIHDCCPMCKSVNIRKDKTFNDSCEGLESFIVDTNEVIEKINDMQNKAKWKINNDYVIRVDDLMANCEELINIIKNIKEELEKY